MLMIIAVSGGGGHLYSTYMQIAGCGGVYIQIYQFNYIRECLLITAWESGKSEEVSNIFGPSYTGEF